MLARLLLALALFAPQASATAHAVETARVEANHPVCAAASSTHLDPSSSHQHHDEQRCAQCPRPAQAASETVYVQGGIIPSSSIRLETTVLHAAASAAFLTSRGPPAVLA